MTPTYNNSAMTPPTTPGLGSQNVNIGQKLDLMLAMFTEQKKTVEDTKATADDLQKHVVSLSSDLTEMKTKVERWRVCPALQALVEQKIPWHLSVRY